MMVILFLSSCNNSRKNDNLLLNIAFEIPSDVYETPSDVYKQEIDKLVEKKELIVKTSNKEIGKIIETSISYKRKLKIGSFQTEAYVKFNDDNLKKGSLRNYTYDLMSTCKKEADSLLFLKKNKKERIPYNYCILKSDIDSIKAYLDRNYGKGEIIEIQKGLF
ncbi:hypothetical protein IU405_01005, partial [Polaribacter sp. BAL334]|nr:hypothetical protein [Polaribacter sp. BAL334]